MKCGNCKLWKLPKTQRKRQYMIFGKALGFCKCSFGRNYPMFNYENCPRVSTETEY